MFNSRKKISVVTKVVLQYGVTGFVFIVLGLSRIPEHNALADAIANTFTVIGIVALLIPILAHHKKKTEEEDELSYRNISEAREAGFIVLKMFFLWAIFISTIYSAVRGNGITINLKHMGLPIICIVLGFSCGVVCYVYFHLEKKGLTPPEPEEI